MEFILGLVDKLSEPAKKAGESLAKVGASALESEAHVKKGAKALSDAAQSSKVLTSALNGVNNSLVKAKALGNTDQITRLTEQQNKLKTALTDLKPKLDEEAKAAAAAKPHLNSLEEAITSLINPAQLAEVAVIAVTGAIIGLGLAFGEGADKYLEVNGALAKMTAQLDALGSSSGTSGKALLSQFDELSEKLPQTRDQLAELSKPLLALGLSGDKLNTALTAQSSALALGGDAAAGTFENLQKKIQTAAETGQALKIPIKGLGSLASLGINANDIAQQMGVSQDVLAAKLKKGTVDATAFGDALNAALIKKGAPALEQANLSMDSLKAKTTEAFDKLFEDTNKADQGRQKFAAGLKGLSGLLDQNTASGKMLHDAITGIYDKFFTLASETLPYVELGFLTVENAGLKVYIASKPLIHQLEELSGKFGDSGDAGKLASIGIGSLVFQLQLGATMAASAVAQINLLIDAYTRLTTAADGSGKAVSGALGGGSTASGVGNAVQGTLSALSGGLVSMPAHAQGGKVTGITGGLASVVSLPANASGGLVQAAPGEGLASVGTGERILPANASQGSTTVNHISASVVIHKEAGSKDEDITEEQLSLVLERVALKQGMGRAA